MTSTHNQHAVFLSYSSHDKFIADNVVAAIEKAGISCWIAPRDVVSGRPYAESIMQALQSSRLLVLIFTSHANDSPHVLREVERFVSQKRTVLCLRIENVLPSGSMEYLISATHWADAVGLDRASYCVLALQHVSALLNAGTGPQEAMGFRRGGAPCTFTPSALSKTPTAVPVLAVLPFEDHSQSKGYQYLCDGVGEDVIMRLAETPNIQVVSTHAVALLRQQGLVASEIAARLGAGWFMEGSVTGDGLQFRLNVRLVDAKSHAIQWAQALDFEPSNLFQTQQRLAEHVCQGLGVRLASAVRKPEASGQTQNSAALDLYFRARYQTSRRDRESLERAIALYDAAINHDPSFVRAWARLSEVFTLCANYGYAVTERPGARALDYAERAVMLDEAVPEAQVAMGLSLRTSHFAQSAERFRLALSLFPSNVEAHHYLAHVLVLMGEYGQAEVGNLKALAIDPLYVMARAHLARILVFAGRRREAMEHLEILEQDNFSPALVHSTRGWLYWCEEDWTAASVELTQAMPANSHSIFDSDICADVLRRLGHLEEAKNVIEKSMTAAGRSHLLAARLSRVFADRGNPTEAESLKSEALTLLDNLAAGWLEPRSAVYLYNRAWIFAVAGDPKSAAESLVNAIQRGYRHFAEIALRPDWGDVRTQASVAQFLSAPHVTDWTSDDSTRQ